MKLIKKALIGLALLFIGLFAVGVIAGFVSAINETIKETTPVTKQQPVEKDDTPVEPTLNKVTPAERAEFMSGCDQDGTMTAYCECAINYLEQTLGREGIIDMANNMTEGDLPQPMVDALDACFNKL